MGAARKPLTGRGVAKVPVIMQLEALECGAACLSMILAYYGKWLPLEQTRLDCGVSRDGSNARNVLVAARHYGMKASGYRFEPESLRKEGQFPCIIHWNFNHFVVLDGFRGGKAYLNDPARGAYAVSMEDFDKAFTGICLFMEPGEDFVPSGKKRSMWRFAGERLRQTGSMAAVFFAVSVITALLSLVSPAFDRYFYDVLLTGQNYNRVVPFLIFLAGLDVVEIALTWIRSVHMLRLNGKMAAVGSCDYMWKVLKMPIAFFSQRMAGDIISRKDANAGIASTLINTFTPLVINAFMMVFYLVVILRYSLILSLIGMAGLAANAVTANVISKKRVNLTRVQMRDSAKLSSCTVSGVEMIETIKAGGAEDGYFARWSGYQAALNARQVSYTKLNAYLGMIPSIVSGLSGTAILMTGVYLTMKGEFTIGAITAFQTLLAGFSQPVNSFIGAGQTLQEMRTEMERVEDVMLYPDDEVFSDEPLREDVSYEKLSGHMEMKNVTFGYAPLAEPLIKGFDLTLTPGKRVAVVGASGCGKSTVAKLISGLFRPWSGEITFDGRPMSDIDKSVFKGSLAVVDQDIILFEDTIANNIKMWDESIEDFEMILAARDAQIHEDIMRRPGGYDCKLTEGGNDLSGGQRQRLEIARVLAQDPTIIIMDEATSALDARTEYNVVKSIKDRGIACVVVAHRLSTIRDSDEIIVMDKGCVADRGSHEELMARCELYQALVINE